jgi:K+-transporting ATPase ATPase C chain
MVNGSETRGMDETQAAGVGWARTAATAALLLLIFTLLTGVLYPLAVTAVAQAVMSRQANGGLVRVGDQVAGSDLIGQANGDSRYFWPRPSAVGYNPLPSGGSNQSATSAALREAVAERERAFRAAHGLDADTPVPADMLYASGSGLDPHISPAAAEYQVRRVAAVRGLDEAAVRALVAEYTEGRQWGFLGEPRVNVLRLNLALDALQ